MTEVVSQVAESVPFDNDNNGFTSDNCQGAIEEATDGFGYYLIKNNKHVRIKENRIMTCFQNIEIEAGGVLDIEGRLAII